MSSLLRKLMPAIVFNALFTFLFVFTNYAVWNEAKSTTDMVQLIQYNPLWIYQVPLGALVDGKIIAVSLAKTPLFNFPFWFFFVAIAVNMYFIVRLAKKSSV